MPQDANNAKWKSQQEKNILLGIKIKGEDSFLYVYFLQTSSVPNPGCKVLAPQGLNASDPSFIF